MEIEHNINVENWLCMLKDSTQLRYRQVIKEFENYCLESNKHGKIGMQQHFFNYLKHLKANNYKGSTLQSIHSTLCLWYKNKTGKDLELGANNGNKLISQLKKTQTVKQSKV